MLFSLVSETQLSYGIKVIARDQQHHRAASKPVVKIDGLSLSMKSPGVFTYKPRGRCVEGD